MLFVFIKTILAIAFADLLTGIFHWLEDAYGNPEWKYLGASVILPNLEHHKKPRAFIKGTWWGRVNTSVIAGMVLIALFALFHILTPYTALAIAVATQGNEFHRFAHQTQKENGAFITWLQKWHIIQSVRHHAQHHRAPYACHYCVITNFVNPMLESIHFWQAIEWLLQHMFDIKVLRGSALRNGL